MTASDIKDAVFSGFSFSVLKDSGWYGVEERHYENLFAGKDMGCSWKLNCHAQQNMNYFCIREGEEGCYFDHSAVGTCTDFFVK